MRTKVSDSIISYNRKASRSSWKTFKKLIEDCCQHHIDGAPFFSEALKLIQADDWNGVYHLADSLSSQLYEDATTHFVANQFSLLVKKYPFPKGLLLLNPEEAATKSFLHAEHRCKRRNQLFRVMRSKQLRTARVSRWYEYRLSRMRSWIAYVLGDLDLNTIFDSSEFGPGASIGIHGNATNFARKLLAQNWSVTPEAFTYASIVVGKHAQIREMLLTEPERTHYCCDPIKFDEAFRAKCSYVNNNKITFVPKTAKTHRSIAIEPLLNGYLQKGVDNVLRLKLKRVGIHLDDQSLNQRLARIGSLHDSAEGLCTIDLSAASDSMATEVVRALLPEDWFRLLNNLRSKTGLLGDLVLSYEKFCSMGNGFCFPLESLVFAAAVQEAGGTLGQNSAVYGDDIIVPQSIAQRVLETLEFMGFKVNTSKTFLHGPFRESCGADWFGGKDVRPFTLDYRIDSLQAIFKLLNLTKRNAYTTAFFDWLTPDYLGVPNNLRFVRPYSGPADTAIEVEFDVFMSSRYSSFVRETRAWRWTELIASPVKDRQITRMSAYNYALVYGALKGVTSSAPFTVRRETQTKLRRVTGSGATSQWLPALRYA